MKHTLVPMLLVLAACGEGSQANRPVTVYPGVPWYGPPPPATVATAPPPAPSASPTAAERPTLVGAAMAGIGVLLGQPTTPSQGAPQASPPIFPALPSLPDLTGAWPWPGGSWPGGNTPAPSGQGAPSPVPPSQDGWPTTWSAFELEVLTRTNQERQRGAICDGETMPPVGPVALDTTLRLAARRHSQDMAARNYFEHDTPEGVGPSGRAAAAGYRSRFVGENIAAGQVDPSRVMKAWMDSPGHCRNLMDPDYRVLGVGYFFEGGDRYEHYWTQDFGG